MCSSHPSDNLLPQLREAFEHNRPEQFSRLPCRNQHQRNVD
jgi:hypothetical protein